MTIAQNTQVGPPPFTEERLHRASIEKPPAKFVATVGVVALAGWETNPSVGSTVAEVNDMLKPFPVKSHTFCAED